MRKIQRPEHVEEDDKKKWPRRLDDYIEESVFVETVSGDIVSGRVDDYECGILSLDDVEVFYPRRRKWVLLYELGSETESCDLHYMDIRRVAIRKGQPKIVYEWASDGDGREIFLTALEYPAEPLN